MFRTYEATKFKGVSVNFKNVEDRKALVGKRIGFDLSSSSLSQVGRITNAGNRKEVEINDSLYNVSSITQMVLLTDQTDGGIWKG